MLFKLKENKELIKDFTDSEFIKKATWKDCLYDFSERYKQEKVKSVDVYLRFLESTKCNKLFVDVLEKKGRFEDLAESLDDFFASQ